jgi:hypothetical protein
MSRPYQGAERIRSADDLCARRPAVRQLALIGLVSYYFTTIVVMLGVSFGATVLQGKRLADPQSSFLKAVSRQDGFWYRQIATDGYHYQRFGRSSVSFFPAYPLLARCVTFSTGISADAALFIVSNFCLCASFIVLILYLHARRHHLDDSAIGYSLSAFGLLPTTCFFRFAYSESLFVLLLLLTLYAIESRWRPLFVAFIVGAATAARPVGVALLLPLAAYSWREARSVRSALLQSVLLCPLAAWGLLGFIVAQWSLFGNGLAFAAAQQQWNIDRDLNDVGKFESLVTLRPIIEVYDGSSRAYWG